MSLSSLSLNLRGVTSDHTVLVNLDRQRSVSHLRRFQAATGKGLSLFLLPLSTFRVKPRLPLLLLRVHWTPGEAQAAGGLCPCHATGLQSQPAHPPHDILRKGLAAWVASPTPLGHQRVLVPQTTAGEGVPGLLTRYDLHLP